MYQKNIDCVAFELICTENPMLYNDIFIGLEDNNLYNINCVLQLNRSHACVEAMKSMKLSKV